MYSNWAGGSFREDEFVWPRSGPLIARLDDVRLDLLFGYSLLRDLPGPDWVTAGSVIGGPKRVGDVLSLDAS